MNDRCDLMVSITQYLNWQKENQNIATPQVDAVSQFGDYFVELSEGWGSDDKAMYGVTVVYWTGRTFNVDNHKYSKLNTPYTAGLYIYDKAVKYYREVIEKVKRERK
jgi:hypothetical protein